MDSPTNTPQYSSEPGPGNPLGVAGRAAIRRPDGHVLLIQRCASATSDPSKWELPGGKMVYGETLVEAVIREVQEEAGLRVHPKHVVHVGHRLVVPYWVTVVTFLCDDPDEPIQLSDEHIAYEWVPISETGDRPMTPKTLAALRAISAACMPGDVVE